MFLSWQQILHQRQNSQWSAAVLGNPLDKSQVAVNQDTHSWMTSTLATSMVTVNIMQISASFPRGSGMICCHSHILGKGALIYERISWVKDKSRIMLLLQIDTPLYALPRKSKVWGHKSFNLQFPPSNAHTNKVLKEWWAFRVKWVSCVHVGTIFLRERICSFHWNLINPTQFLCQVSLAILDGQVHILEGLSPMPKLL